MNYDNIRPGRGYLEFVPEDKCPIVGNYIIRPIQKLIVREKDGKLVRLIDNKNTD